MIFKAVSCSRELVIAIFFATSIFPFFSPDVFSQNFPESPDNYFDTGEMKDIFATEISTKDDFPMLSPNFGQNEGDGEDDLFTRDNKTDDNHAVFDDAEPQNSDTQNSETETISEKSDTLQGMKAVFNEALLMFERADRLPEEIPHLSSSDLETIQVQQRRKSEFRKTAAMYEALIQRGIESGPIFYNQGNAWYRAGETARAIVSYRQAQRYMPKNPYLSANLQTLTDGENPAHRARFAALFFWQNGISYPAKFRSSAVLTVFTFFIALWALFAQKGSLFAVALISGLLTAAMILSAGIDWLRFEKMKYGVVCVEQTLLRKGNAERYEPTANAPVLKNTEFTVREQRNTWILIELTTGETGWISRDDACIY